MSCKCPLNDYHKPGQPGCVHLTGLTPCSNMAESGVGDNSNADIEVDTIHYMDFNEFVKTCAFPQCVCVTGGSFLSRGVQITPGDVLLLKSCHSGQVTLSYRNNESSWTEVSVDLDYPQKFQVLPPKDVNSDNRQSMVMYPTISDLMLDCPTYFETTSSYDDPYLPAMSVKIGDRFWFVELVRNSKEGVDRLKVRNDSGNILFLSLECRGNFCPLKDDNEYTVRNLVELSPVPRRLHLVNKEPVCDDSMISGKNETVVEEDGRSLNEYTAMVKAPNKHNESKSSSLSSLSSQVSLGRPNCLPSSFSGIVNLLKYESAVDVSPYNDPETTWTIPVSANLKVRTYSQDDYEIPAPRNIIPQTRVPLPISHNNEVPKFRAPSIPSLQQPLVPVNIINFVDIYCSTFPVKAKILDTSDAPLFLQTKLKNTSDVIVYHVDEVKRLYVKDINSDAIYSLSPDLKVSFIEYPEKFRTVSELLHLPLGTEITVLEDIAADFPKPFSLRLGDIIRITSHTPYFIKMKHANRDCQIIKCERVESQGGENTKLKLPMDFEVSMVMTVDSNSRKMISLQDLITGAVPIPNQSVASVPNDSDDAVLKDLPVDLRILKSMKETYVVVAPERGRRSPSSSLKGFSVSDVPSKKKTSAHSSHQEQELLTNIGLPMTSGIMLAFKERLDLCDLDIRELEVDYLRIPIEKITLAQFEERERFRKLNSDYEDIEFGSNSTLDESESGSITRASSTGVLDKKQKNTTMDKMLRLSRALNPKHWRHSKAEPEPLPHPTAMGLMALAARPRDDTLNEYHHTRMGSTSTNTELERHESNLSSSEEEENFYEDVEIGPVRSSTIATTTPSQISAFSGPDHRSLPPRLPPVRSSDPRSHRISGNNAAASEITEARTPKPNGSTETHAYDIPKPFTKAKNWAANIGSNIGEIFSTKPQYDVPKSSMIKQETVRTTNPALAVTSVSKGPPDTKPPLPPTKMKNKAQDLTEKKDVESTPIPPTRRKNRNADSSLSSPAKDKSNEEKEEKLSTPIFSKSISLNDSVSSTGENINIPKPKPRGIKNMVSSEGATSLNPQANNNAGDIVKSVETHQSLINSEPSSFHGRNTNFRPEPPRKPKPSIHTTV